MAVVVQHTTVHTVALHGAQQLPDESTKGFAAWVRGITSNWKLEKLCACAVSISYLEETVYHVVLAGLHDRDMQERCTSEALLYNITDINSLVAYWVVEESGMLGHSSTVDRIQKSTYKQGKTADQPTTRPANNPITTDKCGHCEALSTETAGRRNAKPMASPAPADTPATTKDFVETTGSRGTKRLPLWRPETNQRLPLQAPRHSSPSMGCQLSTVKSQSSHRMPFSGPLVALQLSTVKRRSPHGMPLSGPLAARQLSATPVYY
jgi:hypothetical protein